MTGKARAKVFSIAPGSPFLTTLADCMRNGSLGFKPADPSDPLALASTTIYVPTRRAARALRAVFAETQHSSSAILPTIKALGDFDEDAGILGAGTSDSLSVPPPISNDDRILTLARLTRAWSARMSQTNHAILRDEPLLLPRTAADAIWLARDLASVIDELELEGIDFSKLSELDPQMLPAWWQITHEFLGIVTTAYPLHLAQNHLSDPVIHRNEMIRAEARRLQTQPPDGPVIAAGSTGSIPATAELLSVIAHLPQGALVLPGLDRHMDDLSWEKIGDVNQAPSSFGHPQYALKKLLGALGVTRADVNLLGGSAPDLEVRERLVCEALRPAETTELWADKSRLAGADAARAALAGVSLIEAPTEREEALAIAVALRCAIDEHRRKTAALVTNDRNLARRVCAELLRFGITADDSGGSLLANSLPASLFQLILKVVFSPGEATDLLSLLKHPLARFGEGRLQTDKAANAVELIALRGVIGRVKAEDLALHFDKALGAAAQAKRSPFWQSRLSGQEIDDARLLARIVSEKLAPLCVLRDNGGPLTVPIAARASVEVLESLAMDENGSLAGLYAGDAGEQFAAHLRGLLIAGEGFEFEPSDWPSIHTALISQKMVKPKAGSDPNIFIWGALEARLQEVDTLVLGALNENGWPARPGEDPFLSRSMKASLQLEPPERRIGQAAHDFVMGLGAKSVVLSRATRSDGAPAIASRWLQRLTALIGEDQANILRARGGMYLEWANALDRGPDVPLAVRPAPSPALELRPTRFSITEIRTLRHDPYAIHAKRILKLQPLDPLIRDPHERERGNLFHDILAAFIGREPALDDPVVAAALLRSIAREEFARVELPPDVEALWWPRFDELIPSIIEIETGRRAGVVQSRTEISTRAIAIAATGATLSGRADRIDVMAAGGVEIIDYKTGDKPKVSIARSLADPQLALEAALAARGAFTGLEPAPANDLLYYRLRPKG